MQTRAHGTEGQRLGLRFLIINIDKVLMLVLILI